jgi:hypothetical protein
MTDQRAVLAGVGDGEFPEKEGRLYHVAPERKEQSQVKIDPKKRLSLMRAKFLLTNLLIPTR